MTVAFDYDSPWKEALRLYLRSFMRLCFGQVEPVINWSREPEFLDKELQQIVRDADTGRQYVDMLVRVYEIGLKKADILELYRLVDWLVKLPEELEARFLQDVYKLEQQKIMPYVTSAERFGIEKGIEKGQLIAYREHILELLEARFGAAPGAVRERVNAETDLAQLRGWHRLAGTCSKLEEFRI